VPIAKTVLYGSGAGGASPPDAADEGAVEPGGKGRSCRSCGQQFSGSDSRFCPFDGEPLEDSAWDPSGDALLGTVVDNRYEVLAVLGEGHGHGAGFDIALERPLALKALRDLWGRRLPVRFIQKQGGGGCRAPNVVQITDSGTPPTGQPYFVMELLGATLSALIRETAARSSRAAGVSIRGAERPRGRGRAPIQARQRERAGSATTTW
jgi:hypothetical protein